MKKTVKSPKPVKTKIDARVRLLEEWAKKARTINFVGDRLDACGNYYSAPML
jgi:hypothetical protein